MRTSGILMHITSLPSNYGIGTMGSEAYNFIDFLVKAGQTYWQILPIGPTGFGDSPYQSFSSFAGNPYLIDLDFLIKDNLLNKSEVENIKWYTFDSMVDYKKQYENRYKVLKYAYKRFIKNIPEDFNEFCEIQSYWLDDYSLFMAIKDTTNKPWLEWEDEFKFKHHSTIEKFKTVNCNQIMFHKVVQYLFYTQWLALKEYANLNKIKIIGDLPIYVSTDSADMWSNPELFMVNDKYEITHVAGCPPDKIFKNGQIWGNPIYNWEKMKNDNYDWWTSRLAHVSDIYDVIRIDHFKGFESYYCIEANATSSKVGKWKKGPGIELFRKVEESLGKLNVIAEDLGFVTEESRKLVEESGFAGMKVLQFAFDSRKESNHLPHNYNKHCVVYTGTHDNDTILGWMKTAPMYDVAYAMEYFRLSEQEGYNWGFMKGAWASVADTSIVTVQDILNFGSSARMNKPSTVGQNWKWRVSKEYIDNKLDHLAYKLEKYMKIYKRI